MDFFVLLKGNSAMLFYCAPRLVTLLGYNLSFVLFSLLLFPYSFTQGDSLYNPKK